MAKSSTSGEGVDTDASEKSADAAPQRRVPRISAFYGIVIRMWFDDHPLPHFHAEYAEYQVKISIHNLDVVKGFLPPRALRLVREWGLQHRNELMENWHLARANEPLNKIAPLS